MSLPKQQEKLKAHQESGNVDQLRQEMKGLQRQIKLDQKTLEGIEKDVAVLHKTSEARFELFVPNLFGWSSE